MSRKLSQKISPKLPSNFNPTPFKKMIRKLPLQVNYELMENDSNSFYQQNVIQPYNNSGIVEGFQNPIDEPGNITDKENLLFNTKFIIIYALVFSIALAINEVSLSVFKSFPKSQHIISKVSYVVILFGITILIAYMLKSKVNTFQG